MSRTLLVSRRNLNRKVYQSFLYELEDVICAVDEVDLMAPRAQRLTRLQLLHSQATNGLRRIAGKPPDFDREVAPVELDREYDFLFLPLLVPDQLGLMRKVGNWRSRCRLAACYITELWGKDIEYFRPHLEEMSAFDHIFVFDQAMVEMVGRLTGRPCHFLPVAVDALRFCPSPRHPDRTITCYNMGRRLPESHARLRTAADRDDFFYMFDTTTDFSVSDFVEHRSMLAEYLMRTNFFVSYKRTLGDALLPRMFEGAAGGAVMLGTAPDTAEYRANFDWPDALISVAEGDDIVALIDQLRAQPERLAAIRRDNVSNVLRRHDWSHRWSVILETVGLAPKAGLAERHQRLSALARSVTSLYSQTATAQ
jgi:hypothetical protein